MNSGGNDIATKRMDCCVCISSLFWLVIKKLILCTLFALISCLGRHLPPIEQTKRRRTTYIFVSRSASNLATKSQYRTCRAFQKCGVIPAGSAPWERCPFGQRWLPPTWPCPTGAQPFCQLGSVPASAQSCHFLKVIFFLLVTMMACYYSVVKTRRSLCNKGVGGPQIWRMGPRSNTFKPSHLGNAYVHEYAHTGTYIQVKPWTFRQSWGPIEAFRQRIKWVCQDPVMAAHSRRRYK